MTTQLPMIVRSYPEELRLRHLLRLHASTPVPQPAELVWLIRSALCNMRRLARTQHWAYDFNREYALIEALRKERHRIRHQRALAWLERDTQHRHDMTGPHANQPQATP